jgi:transcriptional regulator with XRE-family HTH domain
MLGHKVRAIRVKKGIKATYLADALNITVQGLGRIERNEVDLNYENLKTISDVFEMPINEIENFESPMFFEIHDNQQGIGVGHFYNSDNSNISELLKQVILNQEMIIKMLKKNQDNNC